MKICIDIRCLAEGRRTGVEEYTLGLLNNLFLADKKNEYVLFFNSFRKPAVDLESMFPFPNVRVKIFRYPNKLLNFFFWYFGWPHVDTLVGGADVLFVPNIIFLGRSRQCALVTTIHDLSFEWHPEFFNLKRRFWHVFINPMKIAKRSKRIIAVSSSTKNDIVSKYGIGNMRITVVPNAVGERFRIVDRNDRKLIAAKEKYGLPYRSILFLGTIEPRKNIVGIVKAFRLFREWAGREGKTEMLKYKLVIAGEKGWLSDVIFSEIENSSCKENIILAGRIDDEDKEYLYNLASLFVYTSFFEGFGFPPLEAMKCGVPVICSNRSSLPEVAGEAALLVDPDQPTDIFLAMKEALTDNDLRNTLVAKGKKRAARFNWERTARETLSVLTGKENA